jgi:prepilin peptidase CpaA
MNPSSVSVMPQTAITIVALAIGLIACVTDVQSRRIPNVLTFGAAGTAVMVHGAIGGFGGLATSVGGWLLGVALFLPFFALGGMGGGDVKLLGALGAWLGPNDAFWVAIYASMAGGVMAVVLALGSGYLRTALSNVRNLLTYWALAGPRPVPGMTLDESKAPRLAYALPIFAGTVVTVWLR